MLQDAVRVKHFGTPGRHRAWEFSDSLRSAYLRSAAGKTVERTSRSAQPRWTVTITEPPPLAEKPPQPASAARLPLCASPRPRSGARRSRRVRAASLPSAHGVGRERCARDVPGDAHDHLVARAGLRELGDQRVPIFVLQKSCAAVDPYPCRDPGGDNPYSCKWTRWNPHPSPKAVAAQEVGPSWYLRGLPLNWDIVSGMSRAGRELEGREVPGRPGAMCDPETGDHVSDRGPVTCPKSPQ